MLRNERENEKRRDWLIHERKELVCEWREWSSLCGPLFLNEVKKRGSEERESWMNATPLQAIFNGAVSEWTKSTEPRSWSERSWREWMGGVGLLFEKKWKTINSSLHFNRRQQSIPFATNSRIVKLICFGWNERECCWTGGKTKIIITVHCDPFIN